MKTRTRLLWLLILASAVLAAVDYYAGGNPDAVAMSRSNRATSATPLVQRPPESPALRLDQGTPAPALAQSPTAELFGAKSWYVAPPSPPPPPPPPPAAPIIPSAPPLPFAFMGRMFEAERLTVFLVKGDRVYLVSEGDVIDDFYQLEKIEPGQLTLLYLPLKTKQTLVVGEVK